MYIYLTAKISSTLLFSNSKTDKDISVKKTYTLGKVATCLAWYDLPGLSGQFFVLTNNNDTMPSIAGKN